MRVSAGAKVIQVAVRGLDHVNIITRDLDATVGFYQALLGLRAGRNPNIPPGHDGRWLHDETGRPILHLMAFAAQRHGSRDCAGETGSIDHVALECDGFDAMLLRCHELGVDHRVNDRKYGDLRQIFVTDPNNVMLELNFAGD